MAVQCVSQGVPRQGLQVPIQPALQGCAPQHKAVPVRPVRQTVQSEVQQEAAHGTAPRG